MTLRNVTKSFNLEDQRQEINVIAADLATFYDNDTDSVSITGELATPGFVVSDQGNVTGVGSIKLNQSSLGDAGTSPNVIIDPTGNFTSTGEIRSGGNPHEGTADGSHLNTGSGVSASYSNAASFLWRGYTTGNSTPTSSISVAGDAEFAGSGTFAGGVFTGAYDPANSATSGLSLQDSGRVIARRQTGSDVVWLGLHGSTTGSEITAAGAAEFSGLLTLKGDTANAAHTHLKLINTDSTSSGETGQTSDIEFWFTDNVGSQYKGAKISAYKDNDWVGNSDYDAGLKFYTVDNSVSFENAYTERLRIDSIGRIKIGPIASHTDATTHCLVYIEMQSDVTNIDDGEGGATTGLVRIVEKGSKDNRDRKSVV